MKNSLFVLLVLFVLFLPLVLSPPIWANDEEPPLGKISPPPFLHWTKEHPGMSGIQVLFNNAVRLIYMVAGVGLFAMFIYGGFRYLASGGDKAQTELAKKTLTNALIGFVIIALSYAFLRIIETFFGIRITGPSSVGEVPSGCVRIDCTKCGMPGVPPNCQIINGIDYCCP